jgi:hypothetical protein
VGMGWEEVERDGRSCEGMGGHHDGRKWRALEGIGIMHYVRA